LEDWDGSEEEEDDEDVDMVSPVVVGTDLDAQDAEASRRKWWRRSTRGRADQAG